MAARKKKEGREQETDWLSLTPSLLRRHRAPTNATPAFIRACIHHLVLGREKNSSQVADAFYDLLIQQQAILELPNGVFMHKMPDSEYRLSRDEIERVGDLRRSNKPGGGDRLALLIKNLKNLGPARRLFDALIDGRVLDEGTLMERVNLRGAALPRDKVAVGERYQAFRSRIQVAQGMEARFASMLKQAIDLDLATLKERTQEWEHWLLQEPYSDRQRKRMSKALSVIAKAAYEDSLALLEQALAAAKQWNASTQFNSGNLPVDVSEYAVQIEELWRVLRPAGVPKGAWRCFEIYRRVVTLNPELLKSSYREIFRLVNQPASKGLMFATESTFVRQVGDVLNKVGQGRKPRKWRTAALEARSTMAASEDGDGLGWDLSEENESSVAR